MKHQALLTIEAKLKLAIIFFLLFGRDRLWRNPRERVARGGKLLLCYGEAVNLQQT